MRTELPETSGVNDRARSRALGGSGGGGGGGAIQAVELPLLRTWDGNLLRHQDGDWTSPLLRWGT